MAQKKFDGVVEAVHFTPDGQVAWVRAYERRGAAFTDRVLIKREALIERLKAGKIFVVGTRVPFQASTFTITTPVKLVKGKNGDYTITTKDAEGEAQERDNMSGVPML